MQRREYDFYVYVMASKWRTLYIGVTNDLERRAWQHKTKATPGFTATYGINQLVYFEHYEDIYEAIAREKQLKGWTRKKKVALIESMNPEWKDLAADWRSCGP
jgi:putative endonuclease